MKVVSLALAVLSLFAGVGLAAPPVGAQGAAAKSKAPKPLIVTDFAFEADPTIMLDGALSTQLIFTYSNPNTSHFAYLPAFRITAKSGNGRIVYSQTSVAAQVGPGQVGAFTEQLHTPEPIATVSIRFLRADWIASKPNASQYKPFLASNVSLFVTSAKSVRATGEVVNPYPVEFDELIVNTLYRNSQGKLVGGAMSTFVEAVGPNETVPFDNAGLLSWTNDLQVSAVQVITAPWGGDTSLEKFARTGVLR